MHEYKNTQKEILHFQIKREYYNDKNNRIFYRFVIKGKIIYSKKTYFRTYPTRTNRKKKIQ